MTHSLKLCRSLRRTSPMYSQHREKRKVRKSRPNQTQSHCKGAGDKLTADPTSRSESPSSRGFPARRWAALLHRQLFPYQRGLFFLGRESPFPPAASKHRWPPSPLQVTSALDFRPPIPTPPCWFASSLWGISSSGSYTGSGGSGPRWSSSRGIRPW